MLCSNERPLSAKPQLSNHRRLLLSFHLTGYGCRNMEQAAGGAPRARPLFPSSQKLTETSIDLQALQVSVILSLLRHQALLLPLPLLPRPVPPSVLPSLTSLRLHHRHRRKLPLSLSPLLPCSTGAAQASLLCSSNGLLCFFLPSSFLVLNLLTKSSRVIEFPYYPFKFEIFSLISTTAGYNMFMISSGSSSKSTLLYDSKAQSWKKFNFSETVLSNNCQEKGVYFNGCLYFVTPEPFSIVCFELESGKWERPIPELPTELVFARLVSSGDAGGGEGKKLCLIGGVGRNGIARSLKVWEWECSGGMKCVEVERLPERMCKKLMSVCFHNYEHLYCFWHQGLICVCCYNWPEVLYFKVSRRTWHWVPKCPSLPDKSNCGFRLFSFVPNLYASA